MTTSTREAATGGSGPGAPHELVRFARAVEQAFARVTQTPAWSMTPDGAARDAAGAGPARRADGRDAARVLACADRNQVGADSGATSTAAWLAHATRQTRARCAAAVRFADALDTEFTRTGRALRDGLVNADQARVIVEAVNLLTAEHDDLPPGTRVLAEEHLLDLARQFDAAVLRRLGKRLFEVVCPEAADRAEGERLKREEERARRLASLSMRDNGDGTVEGRFRLPILHAQLLKKALEALTGPRRLGKGRLDPATGKKLDHRTLLGHGFMELLECHLAPDRLPAQGGSPFTVVVTIGLDALQDRDRRGQPGHRRTDQRRRGPAPGL